MKKLITNIVFGRDNRLSGSIAFGVVALIVLGCTCGDKNVDLSNLGSNNSSNSRTSSNTFGDPPKKTTAHADASKGEMPDDSELQDITKTTLLDFDRAVSSEDFSDFYSHVAKEWQKQTSADSMKVTFHGFIDKKITIKDISSMDADFSPTPSIGREVGYKTLMIQGQYATTPNLTKFELNYIPNGKDWKLSKIVVDTTVKAY